MQQNKPYNGYSTVTITLAVCLIYAINGGVRGNFGTLLTPISYNSGLSYADVSFVFAISQLIFGLLQPVFGIIAVKTSQRFVLICGFLLMSSGFLLTPFCRAMWSLLLTLGLLLPAGTAALSFGLLLSIAAGQIPPEKSGTVSGFLNASSGMGTTILAPILQGMIAIGGIFGAMLFLGLPSLALLPLAFWLCRRRTDSPAATNSNGTSQESGSRMIFSALSNRNYIFLLLGFFTCGFHMAILETHFFNQLLSFNFTRETAALIFSVYGLLTMIGSTLSGILCTHFSMKNILGSIYAVRVGLAICIIFMPKIIFFTIPFVIVLGLTSDSTVSPTAGLVLHDFGVSRLPTLFGVAFLTHQVGCFVSAWLGGALIEVTKNYESLWICDGALSIVAAILSYLVREKRSMA